MNKLALLVFGATIAATPAFAALTQNALTQNALTSNALTSNSLTTNSLSSNALASNALTSNALTQNAVATGALTHAPAKGTAMTVTGDTVRAISLPSGQRIVLH